MATYIQEGVCGQQPRKQEGAACIRTCGSLVQAQVDVVGVAGGGEGVVCVDGVAATEGLQDHTVQTVVLHHKVAARHQHRHSKQQVLLGTQQALLVRLP